MRLKSAASCENAKPLGAFCAAALIASLEITVKHWPESLGGAITAAMPASVIVPVIPHVATSTPVGDHANEGKAWPLAGSGVPGPQTNPEASMLAQLSGIDD